jgi:hypothetical protein
VPSRGESSRIVNPPDIATGPPPTHPPSSQDHSFLLQIAMQTERSIGELKTGLAAVAKASESHAAKIEALNETVHTAKGVIKAVAWIGGILGTIGVTILAVILKVLADHFAKP